MWHVAQMFLQKGTILEAAGGEECCKKEKTRKKVFLSFSFIFSFTQNLINIVLFMHINMCTKNRINKKCYRNDERRTVLEIAAAEFF